MAKQVSTRKYGQAAKVAAQLLLAREEIAPRAAWTRAVAKIFQDSLSSRNKGCPRSSFLALCEFGAIKNVPKGAYTSSVENKRYMDRALRALFADPSLLHNEKRLWQITTNNSGIVPNGQIEVLTTLWQEGLVLNPF